MMIYDKNGDKFYLSSIQWEFLSQVEILCEKNPPSHIWHQNYYVMVRVGVNNTDGYSGLIYSNYFSPSKNIIHDLHEQGQKHDFCVTFGQSMGFDTVKMVEESHRFGPRLCWTSTKSNYS